MRDTNTTARQLAKKLGLNHTTVSRWASLLKLDISIQKRVERGELSGRHAREVARIEDHTTQKKVVARVHREQLTATQTEQIVKEMLGEKRRPKTRAKQKVRGAKSPLTFQEPGAEVLVIVQHPPGATYHDVDQALRYALGDVKIRIDDGRVDLQ